MELVDRRSAEELDGLERGAGPASSFMPSLIGLRYCGCMKTFMMRAKPSVPVPSLC